MTSSLLRVFALSCIILIAACNDSTSQQTAAESPSPSTESPATESPAPESPGADAPDYWPSTEWSSATPESHGFTTGALDTLAADALSTLPYYTSLLVIKDGYIVHESYNNGSDDTTRHHVFSITKSITSLTTGRAWTKGDIDNLDLTVGDVFDSSIVGHLPADDSRRNISLRNVLQMRSGLAWNESAWLISRNPVLYAYASPACTGASDKTLCYLLNQRLAYAPGSVWNYNTYDPYIISGFFKEITGQQLSTYAGENLFAPLGITSENIIWPALTPLGSTYTFGGGLLEIRSRDLAKLGMLVLYNGQWDGQQLISRDWMDMSLQAQGPGKIAAFDEVTGEPFDEEGKPLSDDGDIRYGMQWWRSNTPAMTSDDVITAIGLYGQVMAIKKASGLIIVLTCAEGSTEEARGRYDDISQFITTHIINKLAP